MNSINTPEELLKFMDNNIEYGYLGKNRKIYHYDDPNFNRDWYDNCILETKEEVLKNLHGTCFDQVEFERDWFLEHGYEIKTIYEMVLLDYDNNYPTHTYLIYKDENNKWNWFENADFNNRGIHTFNTVDEVIKYQYDKYIEFLTGFNISDEEIQKIIITEFNKPKEHSTMNEYMNYVVNSKQIK